VVGTAEIVVVSAASTAVDSSGQKI
jgi:hypothetical protein